MAPTDREFESLVATLAKLETKVDAIQSTLDRQHGALAVWKFLWGSLGISVIGIAGWVAQVTRGHG